MRRIICRPNLNQLPATPLPLYVRSAGYNEAEAGWHEFFPAAERNLVQIFWSVRGRGRFRLGKEEFTLPPYWFIYHLPGDDHDHAALDSWAYHWFTLDGPLALQFIQSYAYPRSGMSAGVCPVELFMQLERLLREMSPFSQRKMLSIATEILALAGKGNEPEDAAGKVVDRFIELAQAHYADPSINVNILADRLEVHRTTLTRLFRHRMLIPPGEYIMQLRLQRALSLLRETDYPIHKIGEQVGIPHRGYFCSLIHRLTGVSPKDYRKQRSIL